MFTVPILLALGACGENYREPPKVVDGVIDLSDWDFERDGSVQLEGDWHFWWKELHGPETLLSPEPPKPHSLYPAPSWWLDKPNPLEPSKVLDRFGYATFAATVILPAKLQQLWATELRSADNSYRIYLASSASSYRTIRLGKLSLNIDESIPSVRNVLTPFISSEGNQVTFIVQSSSLNTGRGGSLSSVTIGNYTSLAKLSNSDATMTAIVFAVLLAMGIYHLLIFQARREDRASLWLGILCLAASARQITVDRLFIDRLPETTFIYEVIQRLDLLTIPIAALGLTLFFQHYIRQDFINQFILPLKLVALVCCTLVLVTPIDWRVMLIPYLQGFVLTAGILAAVHVAKAAKQHVADATLTLISLVLLVLAMAWEVYVSNNYSSYIQVVPITFVAFIMTHSWVLAKRFAHAHHTAEHLTHNLQEEVDKQTQELWDANESLRVMHAQEMASKRNALIQNEKLSQLGQLIASIGHELATPIMLITMSTDNKRQALKSFRERLMPLFTGSAEAEEAGAIYGTMLTELSDMNEKVGIASKRLKNVSHALRTQARNDVEAVSVSFNEVIDETLIIVSGRIKTIEVRKKLDELPPVVCYRSRMGQVLTNIIANAADALHKKIDASRKDGIATLVGEISIESQSLERDNKEGVLVTVSDNGDGVPESIREKIFEEFFTTKPAGEGTGLGLSMCMDLVREQGGTLAVSDCAILGGARFELWIPIEHPELNKS